MSFEFTPDELKEAIRAARVFNHGFSEEQFQTLIDLEARFRDSGYLEGKRLLRENEELEQKLAARQAEMEALESRVQEKEEKYRGVIRATQDAATQLEELRCEKEREEKELAAFKKKAAGERERIDKELAEYRQKADVTEEEVATASQIKPEVARYGFSLELALGIAQEFASYEDACEKLAEALEKHGKFTDYLNALQAQIEDLEESRRQREDILSRLRAEQEQREAVLSQLKTEIAEKGELVGFYHRFVHLRPLMEYLGRWDQVTFHHCLWCGALFWILCPGKVPSRAYRCPWCGLLFIEADRNAYSAVGWPPGTPFKLLP